MTPLPNRFLGGGAGDAGDAQAVFGGGQIAEVARFQGVAEGGVHAVEVLFAGARQPEGAVFVANIEPPAVPVIPDSFL